ARARQLQGTSGSGNSGGGSTGGSSVSGNKIVGYAMGFVGCPYVSGGISPSGFDCSGFTQYVYAYAGKYLPHDAAAQSGYGTAVSKGNLQPGDLVFFATSGGGINHVGIYVGGGNFIAANTGHAYRVQVQPLFSGYWAARYVCARHI
ncbi:MAG TPA: C40 family peptidase, partial [Clostridia bacterium]|nr:C40 family peptidase [Clostridia bacterium]